MHGGVGLAQIAKWAVSPLITKTSGEPGCHGEVCDDQVKVSRAVLDHLTEALCYAA
jgi:hypothetical protein